MKTYTEYEPGDITIPEKDGEKMDEVHAFLMGQMFVIGLTGFKPVEGDPPDDKLWPVKKLIAQFLNEAQRQGISITKAEVPQAFKDGMA